MGVLPNGKLLAYVVDLDGLEPDVADQIESRIESMCFSRKMYPASRKYDVFWELDTPIAQAIGCPPDRIHPLVQKPPF